MSAGEASSEINTHYYSIASQLHAAQLVLLQIISLRKLMLENNITDSNIWVETHHIIPLTLPGNFIYIFFFLFFSKTDEYQLCAPYLQNKIVSI